MVASLHDDHAFAALDAADAGDDAGGVDVVVVHAVGGERRQFEERRARIDQAHHALARQQLAAPDMALARLLRAADAASARRACSSSTSARMRAALARNSALPVSIADGKSPSIPPRFRFQGTMARLMPKRNANGNDGDWQAF